MKQLGKKALRIFVRLERLGIIWNGCFTVHDMCAETLYILCAFGDSTLNPLSGMQSLGGDTRQEFWIDSVCAVFRSVVVLKSCLVMSCWNLHVFLRLTVILLLLFLQVSPFFLCALAHIIMQLIFRPSAKKHLRQHSAILAPGIIVQNCGTNVTNDAALLQYQVLKSFVIWETLQIIVFHTFEINMIQLFRLVETMT